MKVTNNLDAIQIFINGKQVSHDAVDQWELKRMRKVYPFLKRQGFKFEQPELTVANLDFARNHLATTKMQKTPDQLRAMLKRRYHIGALAAKVMVKLSRGKRKFCMTEFFIKTDIPVSEFLERVTRIVMEETTQNFFLNLATNPDHYCLVGAAGNTSEILECPAESPVPFRFWGDYDDVANLQSPQAPGYTHRLAGSALLEDGFEMGALHHQLKQEPDGIRMKAIIEFPTALPNRNFKMHQYHLACEFRQWLGYVINGIG